MILIAFVKRKTGKSVQRSYNAAYWRERAEEARAIAAVMTTPIARREMLQIAVAYEMLAERAERTVDRRRYRATLVATFPSGTSRP